MKIVRLTIPTVRSGGAIWATVDMLLARGSLFQETVSSEAAISTEVTIRLLRSLAAWMVTLCLVLF